MQVKDYQIYLTTDCVPANSTIIFCTSKQIRAVIWTPGHCNYTWSQISSQNIRYLNLCAVTSRKHSTAVTIGICIVAKGDMLHHKSLGYLSSQPKIDHQSKVHRCNIPRIYINWQNINKYAIKNHVVECHTFGVPHKLFYW